jgi:hypothetical protein
MQSPPEQSTGRNRLEWCIKLLKEDKLNRGPSIAGCAAIFGSTQIKANMKRIFIHFEVNETGFIRLFCVKANRRILHAKRIETEANFLFFKKDLILIEA